MSTRTLDVIVIGGGQAGLAAAYYLKRNNMSYLVLDKGEQVGEVWRDRYDSLTLFTPQDYSQLPGLGLKLQSSTYPTKLDIAAYLQRYAQYHDLQMEHQAEVLAVTKTATEFQVKTDSTTYTAHVIIVATGPFQTPFIPNITNHVSINQLHSSTYRSPNDLVDGPVLVVGGGNSGAQIAVELAECLQGTHPVYLSVSRPLKFMPLQFLGKSTFWWLDQLGILNAPAQSFIGQKIQRRADPIFGYELQELLSANRVILKPRAIKVSSSQVMFSDETSVQVSNIIWATGFKSEYGWLQIEGATGQDGRPVHNKGISPIEGLYYVGLPYQTSRNSALIGGVGRDAEFVVKHIRSNGG